MTHSENYVNAVKILSLLTAEELKNIVPIYNSYVKIARKKEASKVTKNFSVGDVLGWISTKKAYYGQRHLKFSKYNRAGTAVVGFECDENGVVVGGQWTVAVSLLNKVNGKVIPA